MTKTEILNYTAVEPYILYNKKAKNYGIALFKERDGDHIIIIDSNSELKNWNENCTIRANFYKINDDEIKKVNYNLLEIIEKKSLNSTILSSTNETKNLIEFIKNKNKIKKEFKPFERKVTFKFTYNFNGYEETIEDTTFNIDRENSTIKIYKNNKLERIISNNIEWYAIPNFKEEENDEEEEIDIIEEEE